MNNSIRTFDTGQRAVLESIARGTPIGAVLNEIVLLIEQQAPGMLCSILLLEGDRLRHGAAPHLPKPYQDAIDGSVIGPGVGSCGTAAFTGKQVVIDDIRTHPSWQGYREYALPYGLAACWSTPIKAPSGDVLGTFAMYYQESRRPALHEMEWVDVATHLASIAILRDRTERELRQSEARAHDLARLHAIASSINKQIVRAKDARSLYDLACKIAVKRGLARLAWLGLLDESGRKIRVVSQYAETAPLPIREFDIDAPEYKEGLAARAIATGEPAIAPDRVEDAPAQWLDALQERGLRSCALFPLKDDERIYGVFTLFAAEPNRFQEQETQVLMSLAADISFGTENLRKEQERKRIAEAMQASERLRALILSTVEDGIFYLQREGEACYRFLSVNRAFLEMFGTTEERIVGRSLSDVLSDSVREMVLERYRRACETGGRESWEEVVHARSGLLKHVEISIVPIFDTQGQCTNFVGTTHDVTARIEAEAERARLVAQLNHSQRMQALGTLAGGIAHDFNNILAAIAGNAGLALQEPKVDGAARTHLLEIQKAAQRANGLVRQILTFSRPTALNRKAVASADAVSEAIDLLRATLPRSIAVETQFAAETPTIEVDPTHLHQIVMNLGTNAAHAVRERGGLIRIRLDTIEVQEGSPPVPRLVSGRYMRLQVIDNGRGMDAATVKRAFDPFFTTRPPGEGTGLGLSVVHGIVESHRGAVEILSRVNEGTNVVVYLPIAGQSADQNKDATAPALAQGERVMYVDDEEALVFLMERALGRLGYKVTGFTDPAAALGVFRSRPHDFDVIVTDIAMPGLSGADLAKELRRVRETVPIIMTSGYIRPEDLETARRLNIDELLYKSNTIEELVAALGKVIDGLGKRRADKATH